MYYLEMSPSTSREEVIAHPMTQEIVRKLEEYSVNGIPPLAGFVEPIVSHSAMKFLFSCDENSCTYTFRDRYRRISAQDAARQQVIKELIITESNYIRHLKTIIDVYIAVAHGLQEAGLMLNVETQRLFLNMPDVYSASLEFWNACIWPMIKVAHIGKAPYDASEMWPGFCRIRFLLQPYEEFVSHQTMSADYLRFLSRNDSDFNLYLQWCGRRNEMRLQLSDIMVMPMQRLTKYELIIRRILTLTDYHAAETEVLFSIESFARQFVGDVNRTITQMQLVESLEAILRTIEFCDVDYHDEELERLYTLHSCLNLSGPMIDCRPHHKRALVYSGDVRYKDLKGPPLDAHILLLTDVILITRKLSSKAHKNTYKLIRPKYFVSDLIFYGIPAFQIQAKPSSSGASDAIYCVVTDAYGTAVNSFSLMDINKESQTIKIWEAKFREAQLAYDMGKWLALKRSRDLLELDIETDPYFRFKRYFFGDESDATIEARARASVEIMIHKPYSGSTPENDSLSDVDDTSTQLMLGPLRSRSSPSSSQMVSSTQISMQGSLEEFDDAPSTSESQLYQCGASVEHIITPTNPDEGSLVLIKLFAYSGREKKREAPTLITVNVSGADEAKAEKKKKTKVPTTPTENHSFMSSKLLAVDKSPSSGIAALVHSLPNLAIDINKTKSGLDRISPSERLFRIHAIYVAHNRKLKSDSRGNYLSPDQRGISYPPPTPTRGILNRAYAFSTSPKHPPLQKVGHVDSQVDNVAGPSSAISPVSSMDVDIDNENHQVNFGSQVPLLATTPEKKSKSSAFRKMSSRSQSPKSSEEKKGGKGKKRFQ